MDEAYENDELSGRLAENGWNLAILFTGDSAVEKNRLDQAIMCMANVHGRTRVENSYYNGWTALHWAAYCARAACVLELLKRQPELLKQPSIDYQLYPLHCAVKSNSLSVFKSLLFAGADPNVQDHFGDTAAHNSARNGNIEFIRQLLVFGCDLSKVNMAGLTAADMSQLGGHVDCACYLQQAGRLQGDNLYPPYCNRLAPSMDNNGDETNGICEHQQAMDAPMDVEQGVGQQTTMENCCVAGSYSFIPFFGNDVTPSMIANGHSAAPSPVAKGVKRPMMDDQHCSAEYAFKRSKLLG